MEILLTGASGFIGSRLLPQLLRDGHEVRAMTRDPARLLADPAALAGSAEVGGTPRAAHIVRADAVTGEGLERALSGAEVAYYLIHSMEPSASNVGFSEREWIAAQNFAAAAGAAGVRRIVYLGGLVPRWEPARGRAGAARSR
ncbi:MAG TPA: NAD(P)H-binding protein, partial [Solirubrobacteraceae bacterium]